MIDRVVTSGDDGVRTYSVGKGRINVDSADALTALKALFSADYSNFLKEDEESEQACQELGVSVSFSGEGELSRPGHDEMARGGEKGGMGAPDGNV